MRYYANTNDITPSKKDGLTTAQVLTYIDAASRMIDDLAGRRFGCWYGSCGATRTPRDRDFEIPDVLQVETCSMSDYSLFPVSRYPKTRLKAGTDETDTIVEIAGLLGAGNCESGTPWRDHSTITLDADTSTITVSGTALYAGDCLLIGRESAYVYEVSGTSTMLSRTDPVDHVAEQLRVLECPAGVHVACKYIVESWLGVDPAMKSERIGPYQYERSDTLNGDILDRLLSGVRRTCH